MKSIESRLPAEYGDLCLGLARALVDQDLPSSITFPFFAHGQYLQSLRNLTSLVGQKYWFSLFGESSSLFTQLHKHNNPKSRNCRLATLVLGAAIMRDKVADRVRLCNVAFDETSADHSVLLIENGINNYVAQFIAGGVSRVEMKLYRESVYPTYNLDPMGIYEFDHARGKV